jgi:hypothetical protein
MFKHTVVATIVGAGLLAGIAHADPPVIVMIGSTRCFAIKQPDGKSSIQQRADAIQDTFIKHLGGSKGDFTTKPVGKKVNIYLNGDLVIAATPEDATAAKEKSPSKLAATWKALLQKAFNETKATK